MRHSYGFIFDVTLILNAMHEKGLSEKKVFTLLKKARDRDMRYADGKILSSMCTSPHPSTAKVYRFFAETNLGDAGLFKGTRALEDEAVRMLGRLLHNSRAKGFIVSGGTEANLMALWAARNKSIADGEKRREVVIPETAHFSFEKAADLLGLKLIYARLNNNHTVDTKDVEKKINSSTLAIVGIAGNTEYGAIDDIAALSELALEKNLHLHVDAAFGGFVIPFLEELGYEARSFDFSLRGVASITIDPHKMGLAPIPGGGILFRDESFLKHIETASPYLTERKQHTILGTRSGASAACIYAVMKLLGKEGYRKNVEKCMAATMLLYEKLSALGLQVLKPAMNILVFNHARIDVIYKNLLRHGWVVSRTRRGEVRLVIMPHIARQRVVEFVADVEKILNRL